MAKIAAVKEAGQEWLDTFAVGATNGAATDKLIAALEACGCDAAKEILAQKRLSVPRNPSGSSVVTDGLTISDSVVLTMFLQADVTST